MTGRQTCVVVGYEAPLAEGSLVLHLACGAVTGAELRYAGRVRIPDRSRRFGRDLERSLRALGCDDHPPGVASPLPGEMSRVVPAILVEVGHAGWSHAGRLLAVQLLRIHPIEDAASLTVPRSRRAQRRS
jgi:ATP-dependent DNA ligase